MMPILYEGDMLGRVIFGPFLPRRWAISRRSEVSRGRVRSQKRKS